MELNYFQSEVIFNYNNDIKANSIKQYANDYSGTLFLFTMRNNSIVYYNRNTNMIKTIDEYRSLTVLKALFTLNGFVVLLYSNGDLVLLPIVYLEDDLFNSTWESIASVKGYSHNKKRYNNILIKNSFSNKAPILSEFLLCGRGMSGNLLQKINGLLFKNVFTDFILININDKQKDYEGSHFSFASIELWINKKIEYLLITIDNYVLIIDISSSSECVFKYAFSDSIYSMILLGIVGFEFVIIQTEKNYYSITLLDSESNNGMNILSKETHNSISPHHLISFAPNSILSVQYYNKEKVLCSLTQMNTFEIYNIYDLTKPLFTINMTHPLYIKPKSELINCFLYEKMLITITKHDSIYYISLINYWIGNDQHMSSSPHIVETNSYNERLWCNIDYSLLEDNIITSKKLDGKIILCTNPLTNRKAINDTCQYSLFILSKGSLISLSPMMNSLMINSMTKVLKESFTYNTLRKLELLNNGLNGLIFEYKDILTNELCKEKALMIKLLWSLSHDGINALLKETIDNLMGDSLKQIKNCFEFKNALIDYLLFGIVNQRGNINLFFTEYLCRLYVDLLIKRDYCEKIFELIIDRVKGLSKRYFEEEYLINKKKVTTYSEKKMESIASLIQLNNSGSSWDNEAINGNKQNNGVVNEIVYVELGVSNRVKGGIKDKEVKDRDTASIIPNNRFSHLNISNDKITIITSPLPTLYSNKILFEKIILLSFFTDISENNTTTHATPNIDSDLTKIINDAVLTAKDSLSHLKLFIVFILLNNYFTISDRMIEEVLIIKLTNPSIPIESLVSFLMKLMLSPSIIQSDLISLNSFSIIQSSIEYGNYSKDIQIQSKESINSFFNKIIRKFFTGSNKPINRDTTKLKTILSITFLFYYYKLIVINKDTFISNQTTLDCIKDLLRILTESKERKNKYLSKFINELRMIIYPQMSSCTSYTNSSFSYYESIFHEMKKKKEQLINNMITINELIEGNGSNLFKQNCLLKFFKHN